MLLLLTVFEVGVLKQAEDGLSDEQEEHHVESEHRYEQARVH